MSTTLDTVEHRSGGSGGDGHFAAAIGPSPLEPSLDGEIEVEAELASAETDPALRSQVQAGVSWSLLNSLLARILNVAVGLVMARLLIPSDYGVFAVGTVVLAVLQSTNELGTSVAVLRWQGDVTRAARTAMTLAIGSSLILYVVCFIAAPYLATAMGSPDAVRLLRVLAFCVVIDGFTTIPDALLGRAFKQNRRTLIDLSGIAVSSIVSIVLAANGFGPMSLAWGSVSGCIVAAVAVYCVAPVRPRPAFRRDDARVLLKVGLPLGGTSLLFLFILNADYVIVGRNLGTESLGFYLLAFNLAMWPSNLLSLSVRRVAIPGFARVADDRAALSRSFGVAFGALASACFLAILIFSLLSPTVIGVLYGSRWGPAAAALQWLAMFGACRVLIDVSYDLLVSIGRSGRLLALQVVWLVVLIPALIIGARAGDIGGVGLAHFAVAGGLILPLYLLALRHAGISLRPAAHALRRPVLALVLGIVVVLGGRTLDLPNVAELIVVGGVGSAAFVAVAMPWQIVGEWRTNRRVSRLAEV